jgi:parallel beta-helix repeat protein
MRTPKAAPFVVFILFCSIIVIIPKSFADNVNLTIEIMPDGSIYPDDVPIQRNGNIYTITKDIEVVSDGISIAKDNIVIDGAGYAITGTGIKTGIILGAYTVSNASRQNITIMNLNVKNFECGIRLENSSNNIISNCTLAGNPRGIEIGFYSNCNQIIGNQITNFSVGILVNDGSNGNNIENNVLEGEGNEGNQGMVIYPSQNQTINQNNISICSVHLYGDSFNVANNHFVNSSVQLLGNFHTLRYNQFVNCSLYVDDLKYSLGLNDIDTSNTVDGKPIYYLVDKKDNAISSNAGQIILIRCDNITIQNVQIAHNTEKAIYLVKTNNSLITQNTISSNNLGIHLLDSENNTIAYNIISENELGIKVTDSRFNQIFKNNFTYNNGFAMEFLEAQGNNTLYHNNFIGNNEESTNFQVSMPGYGPTNIANLNFWSKDGEGNFWSDYTTRYSNATQINGTDIGDTPFFINENNIDYYPLLESIIIPEFPSLTPLVAGFFAVTVLSIIYKRHFRQRRRK